MSDIYTLRHSDLFLEFTRYITTRRLRRLPANFHIDFHHIPLAVGKVIFIRLVNQTGSISILDEVVKVGRRYRYHYLKTVL